MGASWITDLGLARGGNRCSAPRAKFLAECVVELKQTLKERLGVPLLILNQNAEIAIPMVVDEVLRSELFDEVSEKLRVKVESQF